MRARITAALDEHRRTAEAMATALAADIETVASAIIASYRRGGKLLVMGNGGSAADAQHFAAELVGRYRRERRALPALALTVDPSAVTSIANDYGYDEVFARQVRAHARAGDVAVGISTSGNSENVCRGLQAARAAGAVTVVLGGGEGGRMRALADHAILAPTESTPRIQECHIAIIHVLCDLVEEELAHDA
ncbi:MAG TPA: D-sedoheptulose 7-phosphate isomerase [Candidatus Polarisedimenticolaceae bacterium]|nr:D-sedoheptulose 7-phosphate isomerase [Candidatus Polarisedimenticolaceae bacterium]